MGVPVAEAVPAERAVGELLRTGIERLRAAGSELPRLDAELLLGHATGLARTQIVAHPEARVTAGAARRYAAALARRERGEPVAFIRRMKEFRGLVLRVDRRVLIPRPETERLVDLGLDEVRRAIGLARGDRPVRVIDVGTGSGAIAVALATALRARGLLDRTEIAATDASRPALRVAALNVCRHGLTGDVRLREADLLPTGSGPFDVVLANLPYIPTATIPTLPVAASFEPVASLDGGPDGLAVIRRLLSQLPSGLVPGGAALLEIGADQGDRVVAAVADVLPGATVAIERDLSDLPRVAVIRRPRTPPVKHREHERSGMPERVPARSSGR